MNEQIASPRIPEGALVQIKRERASAGNKAQTYKVLESVEVGVGAFHVSLEDEHGGVHGEAEDAVVWVHRFDRGDEVLVNVGGDWTRATVDTQLWSEQGTPSYGLTRWANERRTVLDEPQLQALKFGIGEEAWMKTPYSDAIEPLMVRVEHVMFDRVAGEQMFKVRWGQGRHDFGWSALAWLTAVDWDALWGQQEPTRGCHVCHRTAGGDMDVDQAGMPQQTVVNTKVVGKADPTVAYRLACGHTTIDL